MDGVHEWGAMGWGGIVAVLREGSDGGWWRWRPRGCEERGLTGMGEGRWLGVVGKIGIKNLRFEF